MKYLKALLTLLVTFLLTILFGWHVRLREMIRYLKERKARRRRLPKRTWRRSPASCIPISDPAYKRPDPTIYAQFYLMQQGLAVTWDNPDIELRRNGVPVDSHALEPGTTYDLVARVWNNSTEAPVAGLPVHFSFLSFGVGTQSHPIGQTHVNLGVKGGPNHPAFATVPWTTPAAGHYCVQARLVWSDDVNPHNNLGQENTDVGEAHSPAEFHFQLRNDTRREQTYRFDVDSYVIPPPGPCDARPPRREPLPYEPAGTIHAVPPGHDRNAYPVPPGWSVALDPAAPTLAPGQEIPVRVHVTPPDAFHGRRPLNVHAFHADGLAGGVTLFVERP